MSGGLVGGYLIRAGRGVYELYATRLGRPSATTFPIGLDYNMSASRYLLFPRSRYKSQTTTIAPPKHEKRPTGLRED